MSTKSNDYYKHTLNSNDEVRKHRHSVMIEEYKILWSYYHRTLDERSRIFDQVFKIISVPFALTGALILYMRSIKYDLMATELQNNAQIAHLLSVINDISNGISVFFGAVCIAGIFAYIYYSLESANSRIYLAAISQIRSTWRKELDLNQVLILDYMYPKSRKFKGLIANARACVFIFFNSTIISLSYWMADFEIPVLGNRSAKIAICLMFFAISIHMLCGYIAQRVYLRPKRTAEVIGSTSNIIETQFQCTNFFSESSGDGK